jgi:hypothetical protein
MPCIGLVLKESTLQLMRIPIVIGLDAVLVMGAIWYFMGLPGFRRH